VFGNRVLRRIFVPKRDEVTGDWRKLHNEKLHKLYSAPNPIRMMKSWSIRWAEHIARMGAMSNTQFCLESHGNRQLGRPRRKWEGNIKTDLTEIGSKSVDWIHLPQDRDRWRAVVNTVMNLGVP
jgi:hypothetical protein